ncbi:InlB B-repeat-containing protein [Fibrobacter sp.]|uniref:InlB B-repeat-containing protein n=1 Tax=Fibrobacter sp. TaxID=35828 RepID=UPI00388D74A7
MTKMRSFVGVVAVLLGAGSALAVGESYLNLWTDGTVTAPTGLGKTATVSGGSTLFVSQDDTPCTVGASKIHETYGKYNCYMTSDELVDGNTVSEVFNSYVNTWKSKHRGYIMRLASSIDLMGFDPMSDDEGCLASFEPLDMPYETAFLGGADTSGYKVRNLCIEKEITDDVSMDSPVGFIKNIRQSRVDDFAFKDVRIVVKDSRVKRDASKAGADYYPTGVLAGTVFQSAIFNITLQDVEVVAPMAGGVAGYITETSIKGIQATDDIVIRNNLSITSGDGNFAGSKWAKDAGTNDYPTLPSQYTVFLGGIAGMAIQDSVYDNNVRVQIVDESGAETPSALGGLFGVYAYSTWINYFIGRNTLDMSGDKEYFTKISGGTAMGGLIGEVINRTDVDKAFTLNIAENVVDSLELKGAKGESVFVGGLVGRSNLARGYSVKFTDNVVNVNIADSLTETGVYRYYAGGMLGMGSPCSMDNIANGNDTAFVSMVGSTVTGNLRIAASAVEVPDLAVKALLGGFAGSACFAANGEGLTGGTSNMTVESAIKVGSDSVFVGGFVGSADIYREKELEFSNLHFGGTVIVADSTDNVKAGGVVGAFLNAQNGGRSIAFSSIALENNDSPLLKLLSEGSSAAGGKAYMGGLCGVCASLDSASFVSVLGDIDVDDASFRGDSLLVGGLFGSVYDNAEVKIANTYSIGSIIIPEGSLEKAGVKAGYLFGRALLQGDVVREIVSNYHFSAADVEYIDAFGSLSNGADITANWKNPVGQSFNSGNRWLLGYNVRNGSVSNLSKTADSTIGNGTLLAADMQNKDFAVKLNIMQDPAVWTFKKGANDDLPFFADKNNPAIGPHVVSFVYYKWDAVAEDFVKTTSKRKVLDGEAAEAPDVEDRTGYKFDGWDADFDNVIEDMTVNAVYSVKSFDVTFMNGTTELQKTKVEYGATPKYNGKTPEKAATAAYTYTFKKWNPDVVAVTGNAVYEAVFDSTINQYKISFVDGDKTIQEKDFDFGATPVCEKTPTREATAQYTFTFAEWNPTVVPVAGTAVYQAVFDTTVNQYAVKFMNGAEELQNTKVDYGTTPKYSGKTPVKPSTAEFTYTFSRWNPEVVAVTGNAVYEAVFTSTVNKYNVTFANGGVELQKSSVEYGTMPKYNGKTPEKAATAAYTYTFKEWNPKVVAVTGDALYEAKFDSTLNKYEVSFVNGDVELQKQSLVYGTMPKYDGSTPTKAATAKYTYKFHGWNPDVVSVTGAAVYTAVFDSIVNKFSVVFLSSEGDILDEQTVAYGDAAKAPEVPLGKNQKFVRWSKDFDNVTSNLIVLAIVQDIPQSSSSTPASSSSDYSSSSTPASSSSDYSSSSTPASSSSDYSSSSEIPSSSSLGSSSSKGPEVTISKADIELSGNAIKLGYGAIVAEVGKKTSVRIEVVGDEGVYLDTLLYDSLATKIVKGEWQLAPAPIGKYDVVLTVANTSDTVTKTSSFDVSGEILVQPRSWRMVSIAALDSESLKATEDAAYYWWDETNPIGDYWQYRSYDSRTKYENTRGFWYGTSNGTPLVLKAESPTKDSKIVWKLDSLYSGWNLVANPHGWYVDLAKGKGGDVKFWRWNAETSEYEIPSTLGPYEAVWAHVSKPTTWEISSQPVFDIKTTDAKSLAKAGAKSGWSLRAVLSDEFGKKDSWNFLGAGDASENIAEPPAGMGDHVTLSIVEGKSYLAKSLKTGTDEFSWKLMASATSAREATLSFEGAEALAAEGLSLYVTVNGRTQNVSGGESVQISLGAEPTEVNVRVAKGALVVSNSNLGGFKAVSGNGNLQVSFDAGKNLSGARAVVQLVSLDGKVVSTSNFTASYGANSTSLKAPKRGVYFVRLKIGSQSLGGKVLVK